MRPPLRLFVLLGVAAVVVLAVGAMMQQRPRPVRGSPPAASAPEPAEAGGDVVTRALELAKADSVSVEERWVDDIPELDLAALPAASRATFLRIANGRHCDCGCEYTLAGCRRFDPTCEASQVRARALYDSVRDGRITSARGFPPPPRAVAAR